MDADSTSRRQAFIERLGFAPDDFQIKSFDGIDRGNHVVVAAPTGAGKTLVADYAVARALAGRRRIFYTTPIKALSNQKYHDLVAAHGRSSVGLLTGDNNVNGDAPVVVMTTEVLRNMLYAGNNLDRLQTVVLDEVHYLQDAYRGLVWEEIIINLPPPIRLVCLSATVSNADELAGWIETVRGPTTLVVEQERPVELTNLYMVGERSGSHLHVMKTLRGSQPNPKGHRYDPETRSRTRRSQGGDRRRPRRPRAPWRTPRRIDVVHELRRRDLLPVIYFIFSRAACDDAARAVAGTGMQLTSEDERRQIAKIVNEHLADLDPSDLEVLGFDLFLQGLEAGVAPHHAGMVPPMKEAVEACFVAGLVKVVFATETLALGINMPARTVVIEKLSKFSGETHEFLTPGQYTQLTGRAGRRGIDSHGQAVVLWSPYVSFDQVANLALSRRFVLTSSFRPTYNMAANLVRGHSPQRARQLLNLSFGQYRVDAGVVESEQQIEKLLQRRTKITNQLERDFGPIEHLRAASITATSADRDEQAISFALAHFKPGDVIDLGPGQDPRMVAVLSVAFRKRGRIRVSVVDRSGQSFEVVPSELLAAPVAVGQVELPEPYLPNSVSFAYEVSQSLARTRVAGGSKSRSRRRSRDKQNRGGPSAPDEEALSIGLQSRDELPAGAVKGLKRLNRIESELARIREVTAAKAESLAAQFDRVIELMTERGHLEDWSLTPSGQRMARLYHECDLLVVEAMEAGMFDGLNPAEIAGLASVFVYEERRSNGPAGQPWYPSADLRRRFRRIQAMHLDLNQTEQEHRLPLTRAPDAGFVAVAHGWAAGGSLDDVLADEEFTAGDFVRTTKQLIDLLRQLGQLAVDRRTARQARAAADAVNRDLVAASSKLLDGDEQSGRGDGSGDEAGSGDRRGSAAGRSESDDDSQG